MAGGMGIGGMGMGAMPTMAPMMPVTPMMPSMGPMMAPMAAAPAPVSTSAGPQVAPASYLSIAPQMAGAMPTQTNPVPSSPVTPDQGVIGPRQIMPPNVQPHMDIIDPQMMNPDMRQMDANTTEFSAVRRMDNSFTGVKGQVAQQTFEGLGGAGPSSSVLDVKGPVGGQTNVAGPNSPTTRGFNPPPAQTSNPTIIKGIVDAQQSSNVRMMDRALQKAGFSDAQRNGLLEQIYRENGFRNELLFGTHAEPAQNAAHGRENVGALSWGDPSRNAAFKAFMRAEGLMDAKGNMQANQATADAQARFIKQEIETKYPNTKAKFLDNPNVDLQTSRVVLGDDYIAWRRTDPAFAGHTTKMSNFQSNLAKIRAGGNQFPTPTGGSMANVPTRSYGPVETASMQMHPMTLQQAALQTAYVAPVTASQSIQKAFTNVTVVPTQVTPPTAQVSSPLAPEPTPVFTGSMAIEQAFTSAMPENGEGGFDKSLSERASGNLTKLQAGEQKPVDTTPDLLTTPEIMYDTNLYPMSGGNAATSEMIFAQPDQSTLDAVVTQQAAEAASLSTVEPSVSPVGPSESSVSSSQNTSVSPREARTGVSRSGPVPTPRATKNNASVTTDTYNPDYYLSNQSLLMDQPYQQTRSTLANDLKIDVSIVDAIARGLGFMEKERTKKKRSS